VQIVKNKVFIVLVCTLIVIVISVVDYYTGHNYGFFVFYFLPVSLASWYLGKVWGISFALMSAIFWFVIDLVPPNQYTTTAAGYWNALIRFISFVMIAMGTFLTKYVIDRENKLNKDLQERTEELLATNNDLRAFTYSISHDLKNPVIIIMAFAEILKEAESKLDSEGKDAIERILSESRRMNEIISDLLRLSKIGAQELELTDVNLSEIAASSVKGLTDVYKSKKAYSVEIDPHLYAKADAGLVRILFDNLIGNAMKFSSKSDEPQIIIGSTRQSKSTFFFVRDNGVGFNQEKADKVFDPFVRLHSPKEFPGTGIGLAIVRKIIEQHHGKIWVTSEEGKGTTVCFTLNT
jgi:signal transduction histidine kinase